jgi:hypothetical protein
MIAWSEVSHNWLDVVQVAGLAALAVWFWLTSWSRRRR